MLCQIERERDENEFYACFYGCLTDRRQDRRLPPSSSATLFYIFSIASLVRFFFGVFLLFAAFSSLRLVVGVVVLQTIHTRRKKNRGQLNDEIIRSHFFLIACLSLSIRRRQNKRHLSPFSLELISKFNQPRRPLELHRSGGMVLFIFPSNVVVRLSREKSRANDFIARAGKNSMLSSDDENRLENAR